MEWFVNNQAELPDAAQQLLQFADGQKVFLFYAEMGAGKTTFIKALCEALGSRDNFSSPTYPIVNEYACPGGKIYHFDLYRIRNLNELIELGFEEYIHSGHYCFIEWPDVGEKLLDCKTVSVEIEAAGTKRIIKARKNESG